MIKTLFPTLLLAIVLATGGTPLQAQTTAPTKSGYTQGGSLETGDSVTEELELDDIDVGSVLRFPQFEKFFEPWFEAKRKLNENYGLKLQFSQQALYQFASESSGETEAAGGRSQFQGTWTILGRGTKTPGLLSFRFENRYKLGTAIQVRQRGIRAGRPEWQCLCPAGARGYDSDRDARRTGHEADTA